MEKPTLFEMVSESRINSNIIQTQPAETTCSITGQVAKSRQAGKSEPNFEYYR